jgi:hypothetical protein
MAVLREQMLKSLLKVVTRFHRRGGQPHRLLALSRPIVASNL